MTAYVLDGTTLREIARIEIPTGRGLCHLYACGDVIYGSCFENGLYTVTTNGSHDVTVEVLDGTTKVAEASGKTGTLKITNPWYRQTLPPATP